MYIRTISCSVNTSWKFDKKRKLYLQTCSPKRSSGTPTTYASATAGWVVRRASTSAGNTFYPPRLIMSFKRLTTSMCLLGLIRTISPVRYQPSQVITSFVNLQSNGKCYIRDVSFVQMFNSDNSKVYRVQYYKEFTIPLTDLVYILYVH